MFESEETVTWDRAAMGKASLEMRNRNDSRWALQST